MSDIELKLFHPFSPLLIYIFQISAIHLCDFCQIKTFLIGGRGKLNYYNSGTPIFLMLGFPL